MVGSTTFSPFKAESGIKFTSCPYCPQSDSIISAHQKIILRYTFLYFKWGRLDILSDLRIIEVVAHEPLNAVNSVSRISDSLTLGK